MRSRALLPLLKVEQFNMDNWTEERDSRYGIYAYEPQIINALDKSKSTQHNSQYTCKMDNNPLGFVCVGIREY